MAAQVQQVAAANTWPRDADGKVHPQRDAEFWRPLDGGRIACDLCYRKCDIAPGEDGWCRTRGNRGGEMDLTAHGVLAAVVRQMNGYAGNPFKTYKPGALALFLGGTYCTAGCTFCMSKEVTWRPEKVPWRSGEGKAGPPGLFYPYRDVVHPAQAVAAAEFLQCSQIVFGVNEPLLTWEYTYDVAKRAKRKGLDILIESNSFSAIEAVRKLAPYVDAVLIGIKGSGDPQFYDRWMRSKGAMPAVLAACKAWKDEGVHVVIGDLIAPPHMQTDDVYADAQHRLYTWVADELGPQTPIMVQRMSIPGPTNQTRDRKWDGLFLSARATESDHKRYIQRLSTAFTVARECGVLYPYGQRDEESITCHSCGELLIDSPSPMMDCKPCTMESHFCIFWQHDQHVTDGRCDHCGAEVPIVALTPDELAASRRYVAEVSLSAVSVRTPVRAARRGSALKEAFAAVLPGRPHKRQRRSPSSSMMLPPQ